MKTQETPIDKFLKISLMLLVILLLGFGGFLLFGKNKKTKIYETKTQRISPTVSISKNIDTDNPENIDVGSVEADLKGIETDVNSLQ
jgi:hypothetical protein